MHRTVIIIMVLEVGGGGGWLQNHKESMGQSHFHVFGSGWEGSDWLQNHKKCIGLSTFSWFWKWVGGGRLAAASQEMHRTVLIFMVLEVPGRGGVASRIKGNA